MRQITRLLLPFYFLIFTFLSGCSSLSRFTHQQELGVSKRGDLTVYEIKPPVHQFRVGETLEYDIRWMGIGVGTAMLQVKEIESLGERQVYHMIMRARSNRFLSAFYPVEDEIHSYIDVETLVPYKYRKIQREGRYRADEEMVYDQTAHRATYRSFRSDSVKEMEIPPNVQDSLSTLYYFRTLPVELEKSLFIEVNADEKNWRLEIKILKTGMLKLVRRKEIPALLVEPLAKFHGVFIRKGRMQIWFTVDGKRTPLYMKARLPFGIVEVVLKKET